MARHTKIVWPDAYLNAWEGIRQIDDAYQSGNLRQHLQELAGHARAELEPDDDSDSGEPDAGRSSARRWGFWQLIGSPAWPA